MEDNVIIIGTDLDRKNFEKKYNKLKSQLQREELNLKIKTEDYETTKYELEQIQEELEAIEEAREKINKQVADYKELEEAISNLKPGQTMDLSQEDAEYFSYLAKNIDKLKQQQAEYNSAHEKLVDDLEKANLKHEKASVLLEQQKEKTTEIRQQYEGFNDSIEQHNLDYVHTQLNGVSKSLTGIIKKVGRWALAIFGVRSAYMFVRNAINVISQEDEQLKNDIQTIKIALAYTIEPIVRKIIELARTLVGYIAYIVYQWTGRDIFARAKDNLASASKSAKELQKTSASFDKFNKLGSNTSTAGSNNISSMGIPNKVPGWVKWIGDNKKLVEDFGKALLAVFGIATITKILKNIAMLFGPAGGTGLVGLGKMLAIIATAWVATIAIVGLVETIKQVSDLKKQLESISSQMEKNTNKNKELNDSFWDLYNQGKLNEKQIESHIEHIRNQIDIDNNLIDNLEQQKTAWGAIIGTNKEVDKQIEITIESIKQNAEEYRKLYEQGLLNVQQQKDYKDYLEKAMEAMTKQGKSVEDLQADYEKLTGKKYEISLEAQMNLDKANKDFSNWITKIGQWLAQKLDPSNWGIFNKSQKSGSWHTGAVYYPSMPKLASGGIINMPGRGVAYHGGIIGERGAEAVVPLTDTQQMELLGATIGKHVKFDANITLELEGRILAKVLQEIQNNDNFIRNGG